MGLRGLGSMPTPLMVCRIGALHGRAIAVEAAGQALIGFGDAPRRAQQDFAVDGPYDLHQTLRALLPGYGGPTTAIDRGGAVWRATRTVEGPATWQAQRGSSCSSARGPRRLPGLRRER